MQWFKRKPPNETLDLYLGNCYVGQVWPITDKKGQQWFARSEMPCRYDEVRFIATFKTIKEAKIALEAEIYDWLIDAGVQK